MKCDRCGKETGMTSRIVLNRGTHDEEILHYCMDCNEIVNNEEELIEAEEGEKPDKVRFEASPQMAGSDPNGNPLLKFNIPLSKRLDFDPGVNYYILAYKKKPGWW